MAKYMKKTTHVRLLVDFFRPEYYGTYDKMIAALSDMLLIPVQHPRLIERLDFRPDLPRGTKKLIYIEIARLLHSGDSVLKSRYTKNDLFRWLSDPKHCNLEARFDSLRRQLSQNHTENIFSQKLA